MKNLKIRSIFFSLMAIAMLTVFLSSCDKNDEPDTNVSLTSVESYIENIDPIVLPKGYENNKEIAANYLENASIDDFKEMEKSYLIQMFLQQKQLYEGVYSNMKYEDLLSEIDLSNLLNETDMNSLSEFLSNPSSYHNSIESRACACQVFDYITRGWCDVRCRYKFNGKCITEWHVWKCSSVNFCGSSGGC